MDVTQTLGSVLIVGGCGFLGHRIAKSLLQNHASSDISVLDVRTDRKRLPRISLYNGDMCSKSVVQSIFAHVKPQVIFHTAYPPAHAHNLDFFMKVNVQGTRNLLECAQEVQIDAAFVYRIQSTTSLTLTRALRFSAYLSKNIPTITAKLWLNPSASKPNATTARCPQEQSAHPACLAKTI